MAARGPVRSCDLITPDDLDRIRRSDAKLPRPARRHGLTPAQIREVRSGAAAHENLLDELYPPGMRVRLDARLAGWVPGRRAPEPGEEGTLERWEAGGKAWVAWDDPLVTVPLLLADEFTLTPA